MTLEIKKYLSSFEATPLCFLKGDKLFEKGETPENILVIESGSIGFVNQTNPQIIVTTEKRSQWLGLREAFCSDVFTCDIIALEKTECIYWAGKILLQQAEKDPAFRLVIMQQIAREMALNDQPPFE